MVLLEYQEQLHVASVVGHVAARDVHCLRLAQGLRFLFPVIEKLKLVVYADTAAATHFGMVQCVSATFCTFASRLQRAKTRRAQSENNQALVGKRTGRVRQTTASVREYASHIVL